MDRSVIDGTATKSSDQNFSIKLTGDANYVGLDTDKFDEIWTDPATVDRTYTFPDPANNLGRKIRCRNIGNGTNKVTLLPFGATKILVYSGNEKWELASFELLQQDDWAEFISDGTAWVKCNAPYWHKFDDPTVGSKASKAAGWTADQFTPGGLEVTFSEMPLGCLAGRITVRSAGTHSNTYYRKSGDANISNTPNASTEDSHMLLQADARMKPCVIWLSSDLKAQFAVASIDTDLYIAYPIEYMQ